MSNQKHTSDSIHSTAHAQQYKAQHSMTILNAVRHERTQLKMCEKATVFIHRVMHTCEHTRVLTGNSFERAMQNHSHRRQLSSSYGVVRRLILMPDCQSLMISCLSCLIRVIWVFPQPVSCATARHDLPASNVFITFTRCSKVRITLLLAIVSAVEITSDQME